MPLLDHSHGTAPSGSICSVIDYLTLIAVTDRLAGENQTQRISYITRTIKQLARELSQLSRACEQRADKRPTKK